MTGRKPDWCTRHCVCPLYQIRTRLCCAFNSSPLEQKLLSLRRASSDARASPSRESVPVHAERPFLTAYLLSNMRMWIELPGLRPWPWFPGPLGVTGDAEARLGVARGARCFAHLRLAGREGVRRSPAEEGDRGVRRTQGVRAASKRQVVPLQRRRGSLAGYTSAKPKNS